MFKPYSIFRFMSAEGEFIFQCFFFLLLVVLQLLSHHYFQSKVCEQKLPLPRQLPQCDNRDFLWRRRTDSAALCCPSLAFTHYGRSDVCLHLPITTSPVCAHFLQTFTLFFLPYPIWTLKRKFHLQFTFSVQILTGRQLLRLKFEVK